MSATAATDAGEEFRDGDEGSIPFARSITQYQRLTKDRRSLQRIFLTLFPAESKIVVERPRAFNIAFDRCTTQLQRELGEAARACKSLDGTLTTLNFNPADPDSVKDAIRQMETAIDNKTARYRSNTLVSQMARELKEMHRQKILEQSRTGQK